MKFIYIFSSFLFKYLYWLYKPIYFVYKLKKDNFEIKLLKSFVKEGDVVLDIGANIGFFTKTFAQIVGNNGRVYAYEPDKINFARLQANCKHYQCTQLIHAAVSSQNGVLKLYCSPNLNVDHRSYPSEKHMENYEVKSVRIDDSPVIKEKVNFVKIDIQGYEVFALQGMKQILMKSENIMLISEFWAWD